MNGVLIDKCANNNIVGICSSDRKVKTNYIAQNEQYGIKLNDKERNLIIVFALCKKLIKKLIIALKI